MVVAGAWLDGWATAPDSRGRAGIFCKGERRARRIDQVDARLSTRWRIRCMRQIQPQLPSRRGKPQAQPACGGNAARNRVETLEREKQRFESEPPYRSVRLFAIGAGIDAGDSSGAVHLDGVDAETLGALRRRHERLAQRGLRPPRRTQARRLALLVRRDVPGAASRLRWTGSITGAVMGVARCRGRHGELASPRPWSVPHRGQNRHSATPRWRRC